MTFRTRFAPSPTGPLHLGHAYSALLAFDMAKVEHGQFLLRIEDTDTARARDHWEAQIYDDLHWLGLDWETPVLRQSEHLERYNLSLMHLADRGLIYPCSCRRSDIRAALSAPQEGAPLAPGVYPGTCRKRDMDSRQPGDALRLDMAKALNLVPGMRLIETGLKHAGTHTVNPAQLTQEIGDPVLGRKEIETPSYVLAAVIDDAAQGVTHVVRGEDLYQTTFLQVLLQHLLDLPTPIYHHHRLIRDEAGKRLAKRDDSKAIKKFRDEGCTPKDLRTLVDLPQPLASYC